MPQLKHPDFIIFSSIVINAYHLWKTTPIPETVLGTSYTISNALTALSGNPNITNEEICAQRLSISA